MRNKSRKHIWPVSLVMSMAIIGALAAFLVLANVPGGVVAHSDADHEAACDAMTDADREAHNAQALLDGDAPCGEPVAAGAPMAPTGLTTSDITSDSITLTWGQTDPAADTFEVEVLDSAGAQVSTMAGVTGNSYMITGLSPITTYTLRVRGMNSAGDGAWAESTATTLELSPEERYDVSILDDEDVPPVYIVDPDNVATITTTAYPIEVEDVKFEVSALDGTGAPLGASDEDVTLTVEVTPNDQAEVLDSLGLDSSGLNIGETLQGLITIRGVDAGRRIFSLDVRCLAVGGQIDVEILDDQLNLVAEAMILCAEPVVIEDDVPGRSDLYTVVSYGDWDLDNDGEVDDDDVTDGFIIQDEDGVMQRVHGQLNLSGWTHRDEPVVEQNSQIDDADDVVYELGRHRVEHLTQRTYPEEGQYTVEVLVGAPNVQLTVTATEEGPAYIRFLDKHGMPFGTDVDEEESERGADVVGLDSQGKLELTNEVDLSDALALAYDQYRWTVPGNPDYNAYLTGIGDEYWQGNFRFFNPCPVEEGEGHYFYVEVYEKTDKYLRTTEKIVCVPSPKPGPTGLEFTIDSQKSGEGVLRFEPALNADGHTVLLIDASNRNIVQSVVAADSMFNADTGLYTVTFENLNNGWTYHIVVIAEGTASQYTADAVKDYGVRWLGEDDVPLSTTPSATPTRMHALCQIEQDNKDAITALLSDCDVNTAPVGVGTIAAQTVMAGESVTVNVASNFTDTDMGDSLTYTAMSDMMSYATVSVSGSMVSITGVAAGSAMVTVTATDMRGAYAMQTIMVTVTAAELGAPTSVMATIDESDPLVTNVTITWTDGANADGHEVGLVDLADYSVRDHRVTDGATSHTFTNVASGRYMAIVVSTMDAEYDYDVDIVTVP